MADKKMTFDEFFKKEGYTPTELKKVGLTKDSLESVFEDFKSHRSLFENEAKRIKDKISSFTGIHSATARVKDNYELIRKIIKKSTKNDPITKENYLYKITDIIGARILYIFKSDYLGIHEQIMKEYEKSFAENIQINVLFGTEKDFKGDIKGFIKENNFYSSIHYTIAVHSVPETRCELQTRTIFEEGVGEIGHFATYKNKQKTPLIETAVRVLVREVELCNDMAELIKSLYEAKQFNEQSEVSVERIQELLAEQFQIKNKT